MSLNSIDPSADIFISYSRKGGLSEPRAILELLSSHFGADRLFLDTTPAGSIAHSTTPGGNFPKEIRHNIALCHLVIVIVSPEWIESIRKSCREVADNPDIDPARLSWAYRELALAADRQPLPPKIYLLFSDRTEREKFSPIELPDSLPVHAALSKAMEIDNCQLYRDSDWQNAVVQAVNRLLAAYRQALSNLPEENVTTQPTPLEQQLISRICSADYPAQSEIESYLATRRAPDNIASWALYQWALWARTGIEGRSGGDRLHELFVNLVLSVDQGVEAAGPRWRESRQYDSLQRLLSDNFDRDGWLLMGDPGCGKSTLLQHHTMKAAERLLQVRQADRIGNGDSDFSRSELCLTFSLRGFGSGEGDPADWLRRKWAEQAPEMPALEDLERHLSIRYLLDGLNELHYTEDSERGVLATRWAEWAAGGRTAGRLAPIFTVRSRDYSHPVQQDGFSLARIDIRRWDPEQIEAFCTRSLGEEQGGQLFAKLQRDQLMEFHGLPINLHHQILLYRETGQLYRLKSRMFIALMMLALKREHQNFPAGDLLTERDKQQLERLRIRELPDDLSRIVIHGEFVGSISGLAFELFDREYRVGVDATSGGRMLQEAGVTDIDAWLKLAEATNLLVDEYGEWHFVHQSWQEFLAALHLLSHEARLPDIRSPSLPALAGTLARLSAADRLPSARTTRWYEVVKLLFQLSSVQRRQALLVRFEKDNPELAAACIESDPDHGRCTADLQQVLLERSLNGDRDVRLRIASGLALGALEDDPRYEKRVGPEGANYLMPKQQYLIKVPAGSYPIGSSSEDPMAFDDELWPDGQVRRVELDEFLLSYAPVTNREYRYFLESGGYQDLRWWPEGESRVWLNEGIANTEGEQIWRNARRACGADFTRWMEFFPHEGDLWYETTLKDIARMNESEFEQQMQEWFEKKVCREPEYWHVKELGSGAKPVVGVSWFEACAYCNWLSFQTGTLVMLPDELQWEAAARGPGGDIWPGYRAGELPADHCNHGSTRIGTTTPVGVFPASHTASGLVDMAGNVFEWCANHYSDYDDAEKLTGLSESGRRVMRGGSWLSLAGNCRSAYRNHVEAGDRNFNVGFRFAQASTRARRPRQQRRKPSRGGAANSAV